MTCAHAFRLAGRMSKKHPYYRCIICNCVWYPSDKRWTP